MSDKSWRVGRVCEPNGDVSEDKAILIAEVHSRALRADDSEIVAAYIIAHDLEPDQADRAMNFFSSQVSLLVDVSRLVEDAGAEFPALVTIRHSPNAPGYVATAYKRGILRQLPTEGVVSTDGWDIFCAREAISRDGDIEPSSDLEPYNYRALRRKIYANRAAIIDDRSPWLIEEFKGLKNLTESNPEGAEVFIAMAEDMEAALNDDVIIGEKFSVIIPTKVERGVHDGAIFEWIPQTGREIVVAHGLDPVQAARVLMIVSEEPEVFVSAAGLLSNNNSRETLLEPLVVPDKELNWISTDFSGRRSQLGYEILQSRLKNLQGAPAFALPSLVGLQFER